MCIPATLCGVLAGALVASRLGKELADDPEAQRRLAKSGLGAAKKEERAAATPQARIAVGLFLLGAVAIVLFGSFPELRPTYQMNGETVCMEMADRHRDDDALPSPRSW